MARQELNVTSSTTWATEGGKINSMTDDLYKGVGSGTGNLFGVIGTSLVQQNALGTSTPKISTWDRGWLSWLEFFSFGLISTPIWHDPAVYTGWEPSGTPGATRYFRGLNAGVSGQTAAQVSARREFLVENVDCDYVIYDSGTNDMGVQTKEYIQNYRESDVQYYLDNGKTVFFLPILARDVATWGATSATRKKANWINQKTREFCDRNKRCFYLDWNKPWVDSLNADGEPITGYSADGTHLNPFGGVYIGEYMSQFMANLLPPAAPRVYSHGDKYDVTDNPLGNILANPFLIGTGGTNTGTGITGTVAANMRVELSSGNATAVNSKETRANNRGEYQVITITPGSTASLIYFRTGTAATTHALGGQWVRASCEVDIGAFNAWEGVSLFLDDSNGTAGLNSYSMEPYTSVGSDYVGAGILQKLPNKNMVGLLSTPPILLAANSTSMAWRVEIRVGSTGGGASGTAVIKIGAVELRPCIDPRTTVNYRGE